MKYFSAHLFKIQTNSVYADIEVLFTGNMHTLEIFCLKIP